MVHVRVSVRLRLLHRHHAALDHGRHASHRRDVCTGKLHGPSSAGARGVLPHTVVLDEGWPPQAGVGRLRHRLQRRHPELLPGRRPSTAVQLRLDIHVPRLLRADWAGGHVQHPGRAAVLLHEARRHERHREPGGVGHAVQAACWTRPQTGGGGGAHPASGGPHRPQPAGWAGTALLPALLPRDHGERGPQGGAARSQLQDRQQPHGGHHGALGRWEDVAAPHHGRAPGERGGGGQAHDPPRPFALQLRCAGGHSAGNEHGAGGAGVLRGVLGGGRTRRGEGGGGDGGAQRGAGPRAPLAHRGRAGVRHLPPRHLRRAAPPRVHRDCHAQEPSSDISGRAHERPGRQRGARHRQLAARADAGSPHRGGHHPPAPPQHFSEYGRGCLDGLGRGPLQWTARPGRLGLHAGDGQRAP
mmetsp:Transcript_49742/g.95075  ORF Transcript_49742/g.95075 Transcript_49742/m.95075 type:complete len:414 (+) Transcript_49742:1507-2748(+)